QFPRVIVAALEHVSAVIRFDHDGRAAAQSFRDQRGDVTKIHYGGDLHALVSGSETEVVDCVVRNCERMKIDLADAEVFARLDLLDSIAQCFGATTRLFSVDVETFADVSVECFPGDVNRTIDRTKQHA